MKTEVTKQILEQVADGFATEYDYVGAIPYGSGHINDTFVAHFQPKEGDCKRYIFQRINVDIFKNPIELMENITGVTNFLKDRISKAGGDPLRETLNVIPTHDNKSYFVDQDGGYWRCYDFVERTISLQLIEKPEDFYNCALAFGNFASELADYPAQTLHETIKDFHNTKVRFDNFKIALENDIKGRAKNVKPEIEFVLKRQDITSKLVDMLSSNELPLRVTHNDTKLNNVLIDRETMQGICVIDLDTVMPGLVAYDFGDSIRFGASTGAEDETDLSKVTMSLELFELFSKGFIESIGKSLTRQELVTLPLGAELMTFECGIRFLTDYLNGDTYFKIHKEHHNLDRARTQFKLVADMEDKWDLMNSIIEKLI